MFYGRANVRRFIWNSDNLLTYHLIAQCYPSFPPWILSRSLAFDVQGSARTLVTNKQDREIFGLVARRVTQSRDVVALPVGPDVPLGDETQSNQVRPIAREAMIEAGPARDG